MAVPVLHLRKRIDRVSSVALPDDMLLRQFQLPTDVAPWLRLRARAFAGENPAIRDWNAEDFQRELLAKPWWRTEHTWLAATTEPPEQLVGAVTLAMRGGSTKPGVPVVHWLMVDPEWRRRGIGRALIAALERACLQAGMSDVRLETHANWTTAVAIYRRLGYR